MQCKARAKGERREWAETGKKEVVNQKTQGWAEIVRLLTGLGLG